MRSGIKKKVHTKWYLGGDGVTGVVMAAWWDFFCDVENQLYLCVTLRNIISLFFLPFDITINRDRVCNFSLLTIFAVLTFALLCCANIDIMWSFLFSCLLNLLASLWRVWFVLIKYEQSTAARSEKDIFYNQYGETCLLLMHCIV